MKRIKLFFKSNILTIIGAVIGAAGGFCYWLKVGCSSGTCPITSSPVMSVIWGMIMGGLIFSMFEKKPKSSTNKKDNID